MIFKALPSHALIDSDIATFEVRQPASVETVRPLTVRRTHLCSKRAGISDSEPGQNDGVEADKIKFAEAAHTVSLGTSY
jgi:hypothetical protein